MQQISSEIINSNLKYLQNHFHLGCLCLVLFFSCTVSNEKLQNIEVLVIGEGTGATSAAIQSARSGAQTILITPISWLGGMMTAAGVSATDGNHNLPSGLWGEFRDSLRMHYGGADSLFTGWVSNTMFEPKVGDYYWKQIADQEERLSIIYDASFESINKFNDKWKVVFKKGLETIEFTSQIVIDGTDLGDVAANAGASFDIGMDSRFVTGETMAPDSSNHIIQDLTYAVILKDFGTDSNRQIERPRPYNPSQFYCSCDAHCDDTDNQLHPCSTMLSYGKLPNGKYMINWPIKGNDYYVNLIEMSQKERQIELEKAKQKTLQFVYYMQTELGFSNLGIAQDEFPTDDGFPLMPYHREGRRIHGQVQLNVNSILQPYSNHLYRTGIAVGDYPIDHHHFERPDAPEIDFPQVPSFSIPLGSLIPRKLENLVMADKAISVTNIVNGASRLQPVIVQVGQAAGIISAHSIMTKKSTQQVNIRDVQEQLLEAKGYILPFYDVPPEHKYFEEIQRVAATGLLKGHGVPYKWANQTWFYPDSAVNSTDLIEGLHELEFHNDKVEKNDDQITIITVVQLLSQILNVHIEQIESSLLQNPKFSKLYEASKSEKWIVTRAEAALLLDIVLQPFERDIDFKGEWVVE